MGYLLLWPIDRPRFAWALLAIAALLSVLVLPGAHFDASPERLYAPDSPRMRADLEHRALFGRDDGVVLLVHEGDPFGAEVSRVAAAAAQVTGVVEVSSPADFPVVEAVAGGVEIRGLRAGDDHPLATGAVLSPDGRIAVVSAQLDAHHRDDSAARRRAVTALRAAAGPGWRASGVPALRTDYVSGLFRDLGVVVPVSLLLAGGLLLRTFRDLRHTLLCGAAVCLGVLLAAGGWAATGTPFGLLTPAYLVVMIVVGTADLVHLVHRFADHCGDDAPPIAIRRAVRELGPACALTTGTTALGFFALLTTDLVPVRAFGLGTGLGVLGTFTVSFLLVPPVLARIGPPSRAARDHTAARSVQLTRLGAWVLPRSTSMLVAGAVLCAVCVPLALRVEADQRVIEELASTPSGADHAWVQDHLGGILPLAVDIALPLDRADPAALRAVDAVGSWLRAQDGITWAASYGDVVAETWEALGGEGRLPTTRPGVAQTLLFLEDAIGEGLVATDGTGRARFRVIAQVRDGGSGPLVELVHRLERETEAQIGPLGGEAFVTGVAWRLHQVTETLVVQFAGSFVLALGIIGGVWWLGSRSWRRSVIAVIANTVPLLVVAAAMGALGIWLDPTVAMVFPIGLGIAVDDSIHFLAAWERARRLGRTVDQALHDAWATAGRSMVDTTILVALGFACLALANAPDLIAFGGMAALGIAAALVCDLLLLPALIRVLIPAEGATSPT